MTEKPKSMFLVIAYWSYEGSEVKGAFFDISEAIRAKQMIASMKWAPDKITIEEWFDGASEGIEIK